MSKPVQDQLNYILRRRLPLAAALVALTTSRHGTRLLSLTVATAQTLNLPKATGKNGVFDVYLPITASGNKVIKANGTDTINGLANVQTSQFQSAVNTNTITLNGTTTGGVLGTRIKLRDAAPGQWHVDVDATGSGTAATPFSNT